MSSTFNSDIPTHQQVLVFLYFGGKQSSELRAQVGSDDVRTSGDVDVASDGT
jgi:hypothetical protein